MRQLLQAAHLLGQPTELLLKGGDVGIHIEQTADQAVERKGKHRRGRRWREGLCYQALNVGQGVIEKRLVRIEWACGQLHRRARDLDVAWRGGNRRYRNDANANNCDTGSDVGTKSCLHRGTPL